MESEGGKREELDDDEGTMESWTTGRDLDGERERSGMIEWMVIPGARLYASSSSWSLPEVMDELDGSISASS